MKRGITRYIVYADGYEIGWFFNEKKAWAYAHYWAYKCVNEDEPRFYKMTVESEVLCDEL